VFQSSPKKQALTTSEQREQTRLSETQHDFVNAKRSAKESQQSGCRLVSLTSVKSKALQSPLLMHLHASTALVAICAALF
jgi:hypothetical protein